MSSRQSLPCKTDAPARSLDIALKPDPPQGSTLLTSRTASRQLTSIESAFCGATAGLISRALIAPFDVIKITLQLETRRRSFGILKADGVVECAKQIMHREGVRGFFKGNLSAEYLYLSYGAAQFLVFGAVERAMVQTNVVPKRARSFVGGALAAGIATTATYPFDLLRTRFVAQSMDRRMYTSILGAVRKIHAEEGIRGFYRGLWPACLQIMPYMGAVFTSYDLLATGYRHLRRSVLVSSSPVLQALDTMQDAILGGAAAVISKTFVYPLDLVRKRLQVQGTQQFTKSSLPVYTSMSNALVSIARNEGVLALFRGLTPALVKAAPASAAVFFVFGWTRDVVLAVKPY